MAIKRKQPPTVAQLKRALKIQQQATAEAVRRAEAGEGEIQTLLAGARTQGETLRETRERVLSLTTQQGLMQRQIEARERTVGEQDEKLAKYDDDSFVVEVNVRRGNTKQVSSFAFVKGQYSLQLVVDSSGSVRNTLGDIRQMRLDVAAEPLHIHRQGPLAGVGEYSHGVDDGLRPGIDN